MANDSYSGQTAIYAGMTAPAATPSWVTSLAVGRWDTVPATNTLADLNPRNDPTINPNFPNNPEWYGWSAGWPGIIVSWNGFVYNHVASIFRTGLVGGHTDYAGNDECEIDLKAESPSWRRIRLPSGAIGNILTTNDGQEASGNYSDGQPRSIHSYNKQVYVPNVGVVVAVQGNTSWSGQAGPNRPLIYNDAGQFVEAGPTNTNLTGMTSGAGACYDPSRHCVYVRGTNTSKMQKYDLTTKLWSEIGPTTTHGGYSALEYIPEHDCILFVSDDTFALCIYDLITNQYHYPNLSGSIVGTSKFRGRGQPRYVSEGEFAYWDNDNNTTQINRLRYTGDPRTATWTVDQYPVDAGNTVTPTTKTGSGTYGRFFVDRNMGIMGVINAVNQPIYFYRYK